MARATLDMLLLRKGPQDLPARRELLVAVIAIYLLLSSLAYLGLTEITLSVAFSQSVSSLAYLAAFVWIVLAVSGKRARFLQTFMGFVVTATVFNLLEVGPLIDLLPHLAEMQGVIQEAQQKGTELDPAAIEAIRIPTISIVLLLLVYTWRLVVMAHIFHHALEITRGRAMALTLLFPAVVMFLVLVLGQGG